MKQLARVCVFMLLVLFRALQRIQSFVGAALLGKAGLNGVGVRRVEVGAPLDPPLDRERAAGDF